MTDIQNPATFASAFSIAVLLWAAACGLQDLIRLKVPNTLTLGMWVVAGLFLLTGKGLMGQTVALSLWGALAAAALSLPGYALNKLGGADVKMLVAIGLAAGLWNMLSTFVVSSFLALAVMLLMRQLAYMPAVVQLTSKGPLANLVARPGKSFPLVFFMAIGLIVAYFVPVLRP